MASDLLGHGLMEVTESGHWRHGHLLITLLLGCVAHLGGVVIPRLDETRIAGALHPFPVLILMRLLENAPLAVLVAAAAYLSSFWVKPLNTPRAVVVVSLAAAVFLAVVSSWSLIAIFTWRFDAG